MKALLKNYNQSPRKVRLVADLIRGKSVVAARAALSYLPKKSSPAMLKLLNSAVSNARQFGASPEDLFVKTVTVNKGAVMRRYMPMARGRAARYAKTFSIVAIELASNAPVQKEKRAKAEKPASANKPKAPKKTAAKKSVTSKAAANG